MRRLTPARLIVCLAFAGIFAMAARPAVDTDTWWHLRAGTWMLEQGQVLTRDEFSSSRLGQPWLNHSWLSQIPLALVWQWFGYAGLNVLTAALVTLAFIFVYAQCVGNAYLKAFTLVLAAAASSVYWSARPQLVSFVLAAAFAWVLADYRWHGRNRLWLLPPLMALWVNLHGGFAIGFLLLGGTLAGQAASRWLCERRLITGEGGGVLPWRGIAWLGLTLLACLAVVPLNPYGAVLYGYPLRTVSIGVLQDYIQEWQSPDFHLRQMQLFIALWLVLLAAVGLGRRPIDLTDLALLGGFTYLALLAARNIPFVALLAAPVITRHGAAGLAELWRRRPRLAALLDPPPARRNLPRLNWALLGLAGVAVLAQVAAASTPAANERALAAVLPWSAVRYVQAKRPAGPLFNAYNWGGFLVWQLYPEYPVFVDGRTDLYDDALLREYLGAATGQPGYQAVLDRYGFNLVLVEAGSLLAVHLRLNADWERLYADEVAVVYQRRVPLAVQ